MGRPKLYAVKGYRNLRRDTPRARAGTRYFGDFQITVPGQKAKRFRPYLGTDLEAAVEELHKRKIEAKHKLTAPKVSIGPKLLSEAQKRHLELFGGGLRAKSLAASKQGDRNALKGLGKRRGDIYLTEITTEAIQAWLASRYATRKVSTVARDLVRLKQVLRWAVQAGWISTNPAQKISARRVPESRIRWLRADEEKRLKDVCKPGQWDLIEFAWRTGLRAGEMLGLCWNQIYDEQIHLEGKTTKSHRRRSIPIDTTVAAILERQKNDSQLVFPSPRGKRWQPSNFRNRFWAPLFAAAALEDFHWHDLRHTFCTRLVMAGAPLYDVKMLAGHRSYKITEMYAHLAPEHLRSTMRLLSFPVAPNDHLGRPPLLRNGVN